MDISVIILKDALMVDVYDSDKSLVLLDLSELQDLLYSVSLVHEANIDTTLLINALLPFLSNRYMMADALSSFLREEFMEVNAQFSEFMPKIRTAKLKRLSTMLNSIRTIAYTLHNHFIVNGLYNHSGVLKLNTIEVELLNAAVCSIGDKQWSQDFKNQLSCSISGTPLQYLQRILSSY
jgi:hypothetical protein